MSNCSESVEAADGDEGPGAGRAWLLRLMHAMVREWSDLAGEITKLGASLSMCAIASENMQLVREMQAFDVLSQRAVSQFRLLDAICRELGTGETGGEPAFEYLIQQVPVMDLRNSLLAAMRGDEAGGQPEEAPPDDSQSIVWFK